MRHKSHVEGDRMSVVDGSIADAKRWSEFMLHRKFRGPGDTIERAAYEAERTWGAPASIMLRLRNREVSDMLLSNWIKLKAAYEAACLQVERQAEYQQERAKDAGANAVNSSLYRVGSALLRKTESAE